MRAGSASDARLAPRLEGTMGDEAKTGIGTIGWVDLTVDDADAVRDFYRDVVGWSPSGITMGDYQDYVMSDPAGAPVAGVCHARGGNAGLPAQWLIYITVEDLDRSLARCRELGGEVAGEPRDAGAHGRYCLIKDPAGAYAMLHERA
jgi:predicted enzyme related to lactoylglutathione lyase